MKGMLKIILYFESSKKILKDARSICDISKKITES